MCGWYVVTVVAFPTTYSQVLEGFADCRRFHMSLGKLKTVKSENSITFPQFGLSTARHTSDAL
jgi:hypothetical protein